jgi:hypothetical protein
MSPMELTRLLTWRDDLVHEFGERAYEIALAGARWGVYQLLDKQQPTIYMLQRAS